MKLSIGIDVHKEKCVAYAKFAGKGEPRPAHQEFMDGFNEKFRRFSSDSKGMTELAEYLKGHSVHILIENSTKSHDVYWMLRNQGLEVTVAHATDLKQITNAVDKNDDNDAMRLAGYMRRRLWGEFEFASCYIPLPELLLKRELCRFGICLKDELSAHKRVMRSHLLIRGWKLTREYHDITSKEALRELRFSNIDIFIFDVVKAEYLKNLYGELERCLRDRMKDNQMYRIIRSIPGFGIMSSAYLACMIDDISRFEDGRKLAAWMGLVPKQYESADKPHDRGITRRGDANLRKLVCQATFVHIFHEEESVVTKKYKRLRSRGKSHYEALVASANLMVRVIHNMVLTGTKYIADPEILAKARMMAESDDLEDCMEKPIGC